MQLPPEALDGAKMYSYKILGWLILSLVLFSGCVQQSLEDVAEEDKVSEYPELTYEEHLELLTEEEYCLEFNEENCPFDKCKLGPSCPICADIGCHSKDYDKDWPTQEELIDG